MPLAATEAGALAVLQLVICTVAWVAITKAASREIVSGFACTFDIFTAKYREGGSVSDQVEPTSPAPVDEDAFTEEDFGHPRGTLAIVLIYAVIFALSWAALYVWQFLERGAPTH
jgi:hypothetical protein